MRELLDRGRFEVGACSELLDFFFLLSDSVLFNAGLLLSLLSLLFFHGLLKKSSFDTTIITSKTDSDRPGALLIRFYSVRDGHALSHLDWGGSEAGTLVPLLFLIIYDLLKLFLLVTASILRRKLERLEGSQLFGGRRLQAIVSVAEVWHLGRFEGESLRLAKSYLITRHALSSPTV